jgi:hypothetical protein
MAAGAAGPGPALTVGTGAYPDLAVDRSGQVHFVYVRDGGVYYRLFRPGGRWSPEERVPIEAGDASRSDPEVALDPRQRPHVLSGQSYAWKDSGGWQTIPIDVKRDTALAIDAEGAVYVCRRGGHNGGLVGLLKRPPGASAFVALPDPDIANGLPKGTGSNHVYAHVFTDHGDGSVHVVARHGAPLPVVYRVSLDGGANWSGSAVSSEHFEAPSGTVAPDGNVFVVTGKGTVYQRAGAAPFTWVSLGSALRASKRDLPALAADTTGRLYATCFGGKYNVRSQGRWVGERRLPAPQGKPLGFAEVAAGGTNVYVVYEEGERVNNDLPAGNSTLHFTRLLPDGGTAKP